MRRLAQGLLLTAAGSLALTLGTGPALAAGGWTVRPGGPVKASSTNAGITDTTGNRAKDPLPTICNAAMKLSLERGGGHSGSGLGSIGSATFTDCRWVLGLIMTMKAAHLPWHLNATSFQASTGTTSGTITGIHLTITGPTCSAVVDGTGAAKDNGQVAFRYVNKTRKLTLPTHGGNLHYYRVNGCMGLVDSGDGANLHATYGLSPAQAITHS